MRNFAETLAYWYLRLNGFFPLVDFVHHEAGAQHGDTDIIAVRLPHVVERIGTEEAHCDTERLRRLGINPTADIVGVVAEVKGGNDAAPSAISDQRLGRAIERMGIFDCSQVQRVIDELKSGPASRPSCNSIAVKILFHALPSSSRQIGCWYGVSLSEAEGFIWHRLQEHPSKELGMAPVSG